MFANQAVPAVLDVMTVFIPRLNSKSMSLPLPNSLVYSANKSPHAVRPSCWRYGSFGGDNRSAGVLYVTGAMTAFKQASSSSSASRILGVSVYSLPSFIATSQCSRVAAQPLNTEIEMRQQNHLATASTRPELGRIRSGTARTTLFKRSVQSSYSITHTRRFAEYCTRLLEDDSTCLWPVSSRRRPLSYTREAAVSLLCHNDLQERRVRLRLRLI